MDQSLLVRSGHRLLDELDKTKFRLRAALWFHDVEQEAWRLWLVPCLANADKQEFYQVVSSILSATNLDREIAPSNIRLIAGEHPAIRALTGMYKIEGGADVPIENSMLNGFFIPDGIVLRMTPRSDQPAAA